MELGFLKRQLVPKMVKADINKDKNLTSGFVILGLDVLTLVL